MNPHSDRLLEFDVRRYAALLAADVVTLRRDPDTGKLVSLPFPFEALLESEQLLSAYFNASRVGLGILDTEYRYVAINITLAEMNGIPAAAHLGKSVREVLGDFAELVEQGFGLARR